jgi:hypothetical protein
MDYLYYLANASLTLRIVEYLHTYLQDNLRFLTVIHQIDGWIIRIKLHRPLLNPLEGNFKAYLNELGVTYTPSVRMQMALWSLETGQSAIQVMRRYQIAVVSHGSPEGEEVEEFRRQFVRGLGYCPETLA